MVIMKSVVIILLGFLALVSGQFTPVSQCVFQSGSLPINTFIEGCMNPPCQLPHLTDVGLHIIFRTPHTIRSMRTLATAYLVGPIGIDYDLGPDAETCNFLTTTNCPVKADEIVHYRLRMHVEPHIPAGAAAMMEFRIVDETNTPFVCIRVPVEITPALTPADGRNATVVVDTL